MQFQLLLIALILNQGRSQSLLDKAVVELLYETTPSPDNEIKIETDSDGRTYYTFEGEKYYVNLTKWVSEDPAAISSSVSDLYADLESLFEVQQPDNVALPAPAASAEIVQEVVTSTSPPPPTPVSEPPTSPQPSTDQQPITTEQTIVAPLSPVIPTPLAPNDILLMNYENRKRYEENVKIYNSLLAQYYSNLKQPQQLSTPKPQTLQNIQDWNAENKRRYEENLQKYQSLLAAYNSAKGSVSVATPAPVVTPPPGFLTKEQADKINRENSQKYQENLQKYSDLISQYETKYKRPEGPTEVKNPPQSSVGTPLIPQYVPYEVIKN